MSKMVITSFEDPKRKYSGQVFGTLPVLGLGALQLSKVGRSEG